MDIDSAYLLHRQIRQLHRRNRRERPRIGTLTDPAMSVLGSVARHHTGPSGIAADLQMASSNVAAALRELETADLVVRHRDPADGRRTLIELTAAGTDAVADHRTRRADWLRRAADATLSPDEQRQLVDAGPLFERLARWDGQPAGQAGQTGQAGDGRPGEGD